MGGRRVVFLPDSKSFITVAEDWVTPVGFDTVNGRELRRFIVPADLAKTATTRDLRISADGKTLITSAEPLIVGHKMNTARWYVARGRPAEPTGVAGNSRTLRI